MAPHRPEWRGDRLSAQPRLTYEDFETQRNAAVAGLGIAQLPADAVADDVAAGRLVELLPEWRARDGTIYLGFPGRRGLRPAVRALIDELAEGFVAMPRYELPG